MMPFLRLKSAEQRSVLIKIIAHSLVESAVTYLGRGHSPTCGRPGHQCVQAQAGHQCSKVCCRLSMATIVCFQSMLFHWDPPPPSLQCSPPTPCSELEVDRSNRESWLLHTHASPWGGLHCPGHRTGYIFTAACRVAHRCTSVQLRRNKQCSYSHLQSFVLMQD